MNLIIQIVTETAAGQQIQEISRLEREESCLENIGMTLREGKTLLAAIQKRMVEEQIGEYLAERRTCAHCGKIRGLKSTHSLTFQTLFGNLKLASPRWKHCGCEANDTRTFSPLVELLADHVSPERLYLEPVP